VSDSVQGRESQGCPFHRQRSFAEHPARFRLCLVALLLLAIGTTGAWAEVFQGRVVGVADGDTITVLRDRRPETIRLNGIDAPEKGQAFGERAKQFTAQLVFGQVVEVVRRDQDRYGRTVGDVRLMDGRSLNHEIVRGGYAWWFRRYSRDPSLAALESEAREARRGLWADPHPVAPWDWRGSQRPLASPLPAAALTAPAGSPAPRLDTARGPIVGNRRSRVYHRPDCPNYADVSSQNRMPFGTAAEAERAGYRLARNCP
jgi:endonuclease YncB( thermonuclease family)